MIIENKKEVANIRMRALLMAIISGVLIVMVFTTRWFGNDPLNLEKKYWAYGILIIYLVLAFYFFLRDYNYVYIFSDGKKLVVKYFSLRPLSRAKRTFEIPLNQLARTEIKKAAFGIRKSLVIYTKGRKGLAKYPPVSLTALSDKDFQKLNKLFKGKFQPGNR